MNKVLIYLFFLVLALLMQICGLIVWPVLNMNWLDDSKEDDTKTYWILKNSWALPLSLVLTSFGWWETYVNEYIFSTSNFLWRVKINMIEEGARHTTYMFISFWKIALFFCLFLLLTSSMVCFISIFMIIIRQINYLHQYFDKHVCLSICPSFRGSVAPSQIFFSPNQQMLQIDVVTMSHMLQ